MSASFPTDTTGLPESSPTRTIDLADGEQTGFGISPVAKQIGDATLACSPTTGPSRARRCAFDRAQRSSSTSRTTATSRHGPLARPAAREPLRRHARDPGADPGRRLLHATRSRSPTRASTGTTRTFARTTARSSASTATSSSCPPTPTTGRRCTASSLLTLDDVLIEDGTIAPFSRPRRRTRRWAASATSCWSTARPTRRSTRTAGEVVRLYLTNTANTRVFNVALPGARMKLVGGDSGRCEREEFVDSVIIAPSERVVVDVLFDDAGRSHARAPHAGTHLDLATVNVSAEPSAPTLADVVRVRCARTPEWTAERERLAPYFDAPPDKTLAFVAEMRWRCRRTRPRLRLPDASRGRQRRRVVPEVRHEAASGRADTDRTRVRAHEIVATWARRTCHALGMDHAPPWRADATTSTSMFTTATAPATASSGKTTWSTSTG